jgi:hypothetical protein
MVATRAGAFVPNLVPPEDITAWDRVKEALRRDWEQTKFDLSLPGGHQLNQSIDDTIEQARGAAPLPEHGAPNPPRVVATWQDAERAIKFGFEAARRHGATYPQWGAGLEAMLAREWMAAGDPRDWSEIRSFVRHGYVYPHGGLGG